jgi:hypothetical protein
MELAARRLVANPANDKDDAYVLRVQFQIWADNDAKFQAMAADSALLNEVKPVSKDLSALGVAGLKMIDYLTAKNKNKRKAPARWLAAENAELARLSQPPRRGQVRDADVLLAAFRPVKVLADALK